MVNILQCNVDFVGKTNEGCLNRAALIFKKQIVKKANCFKGRKKFAVFLFLEQFTCGNEMLLVYLEKCIFDRDGGTYEFYNLSDKRY